MKALWFTMLNNKPSSNLTVFTLLNLSYLALVSTCQQMIHTNEVQFILNFVSLISDLEMVRHYCVVVSLPRRVFRLKFVKKHLS